MLAHQAARPLPAANTQWLNLASPSLPDFTDPRPVLCPAPTGRLAKVLNATLHASDLVIAAPTPAMLELNFAPTALLAGVPKPDDNTDVVWENHALAADGTMGDRITTEYNTPKSISSRAGTSFWPNWARRRWKPIWC